MKYSNYVLFLTLLFAAIPGIGQSQPCVSGTLANVLGTSCTIGNITFVFQNDFAGFHQTVDATNTIQTIFLTPNVIGFEPIATNNQSGFTLVANFNESTGPLQPTSSTVASFSYDMQVNGAFEITGETASISGSTTQVFFNSISAFDEHCFSNQLCMQAAPTVNFVVFGGGQFNNPVATATLGTPALATAPAANGLNFTTQIDAQASSGDHAVLNFATFLYTVIPQAPLPPMAKLSYKNIDLPGEAQTEVGAINDAGDTVGSFVDSAGAAHGYLLSKTGLQEIAVPNATSTSPLALNNSGDVAGVFTDSNNVSHGFVENNGTFTTLDFPGAISTVPFSINDHGVVAGVYQFDLFGVHAFRFDANGFTTIDDPDQNTDGFTEALGVNNRGHIIGLFLDQQFNSHAFLLSNNLFTDIQVPGGFEPSGGGLNDLESIIGNYQDLNQFAHGFIEERNQFRTVDFPDSNGTFPFGINNRGQIIGGYFDTNGVIHSFMAERIPDDGKQEQPHTNAGRSTPGRRCAKGDEVKIGQKSRMPANCPAN